MKLRLYCVLDRVAESLSPPQPARTDAAALRAVEAMFAKQEGTRREDYEVLFVGTFEDTTGTIVPADVPVIVVPSVSEPSAIELDRAGETIE